MIGGRIQAICTAAKLSRVQSGTLHPCLAGSTARGLQQDDQATAGYVLYLKTENLLWRQDSDSVLSHSTRIRLPGSTYSIGL